MHKRVLLFLILMFSLLLALAIDVYADDDMPELYVNGSNINTSIGFAMYSNTLHISPDRASELFNLILSCDEYNIVYTFSNTMRSVTYDSHSGSVNISDRRSFAYNIIDNAYLSYTYDGAIYFPIRMLCSSLGYDIEYNAQNHSVFITKPLYDAGLYTSDGNAIAKKGISYGIVNSAGDVLLPFLYNDISNYDNPSVFKVVQNHKCGIADRNGRLVTDVIYTEIEYVSAGEIYLYIDNAKGMCNIDGKIIIPVEYNDIVYSGNLIAMVKVGTKWTLFNCSQNTFSDKWYDEVYKITAGIQTDNHMIKGYYVLKNGKWGCVDSFGNTVIDFKYDALDKFDEMGRARIIYNGKFGIIDCGGQIVIEPAYDYIYPFDRLKVTVAMVGNKYGALNILGDIVIPFEYDYIYPFNNSLTTVAYKNKEFSVISHDGTAVTNKTYSYIEEFKNGIALAYGDGYGYIDHNGNEIISCVHTDVKQGTALSVFLKKDGKWALFSPYGENLSGFVYDDVGAFENGLSSVSINTQDGVKYGYVNDSGDVIIPFVYSSALQFKYGKAIVSENGRYGIIDIEGKTVIPFDYTGFNPSYDYNVIAAAGGDSKWGLISFTNETLAPFIYDYIFEFNGGYAAVLKNHKYGVIDTNGNIVVQIIHKTAEAALNSVDLSSN